VSFEQVFSKSYSESTLTTVDSVVELMMEDQDEYDSYWYGTSSYPPFHRMPIEFVGAGVAHVSQVSISQGGPAVSTRAGPSQSNV